MKNTTFRKKALLSSVAMLLVALVALGSATFAWFTSSTVATANGIKVYTSKASKLEISDNTVKWGPAVDYKLDKMMFPASSANGSSWFKADASVATAYGAKDDGVSTLSSLDGYVFVNQLNIKNNGDAPVQNVKITISGLTNDYLRVALVPAAEGGENKANTGDFDECVYDNAGTAYDAASGITTKTVGEGEAAKTVNIFSVTSITPSNDTVINVPVGDDNRLIKNEAVYYNLYVWFEGQDEQCFDGNAGQTVSGLSFSVSGDTIATA